MQRRHHDAKVSALNAGEILGADAVDVVILSADDSLLQTLQEAAGTTHAIWHAPSADAAVDLLVGGRCGILIADLNLLGRSDAAGLLERLQGQFPELVLLATGRRDEEGVVAGLISKGCVYRFLHKPVSPARADLFLATATRRYRELVPAAPSPALATVRQLTQPSNRLNVIGAAVIAVMVLLAVVMYLRRPSPPATVASAPPATISPAPSPAFDLAGTLAAAQQAFDAGRLSSPPGDNALERFRAVLAAEPDNAAAQEGVQKTVDALETQVTEALQRRDAPAAVRALSVLQAADPDHSQLGVLREQLLTLSRSAPTPAVARPASRPTASASVATPNLDAARGHLAAGQLLEPGNDNALSSLRQARTAGEDASTLAILATDLGTRLLDECRKSVSAGDVELARSQFATAAGIDNEFELALPDLIDVGRQVDALAAQTAAADTSARLDELLAPAIRLREKGQLIEPAGDNAFESLQSLANQYPQAREVRAEQQRLALTLLENARTSFAAGALERADLLTARAEDLTPTVPAIRSLREQIATARKARAAAEPINAGNLRRTREVAAVYPPEARRRDIEGWVDVEFTVDTDGSTSDVVVRNAQPVDVFDKAASDAIRRWQFEPVVRDGQPVAQRARLRMQFTLE